MTTTSATAPSTIDHRPIDHRSSFPRFFRKAGKAIRQDDELTTWTIVLQPQARVAQRYSTVWPSAQRLAEELRGMEESSAEKFREFVFTFYQQVEAERVQVNEQIHAAISAAMLSGPPTGQVPGLSALLSQAINR